MLGTDVSLGFTSIAGLQVLPLVLAEIWEPFQLNSSWFLISQDTPQVCYPQNNIQVSTKLWGSLRAWLGKLVWVFRRQGVSLIEQR